MSAQIWQSWGKSPLDPDGEIDKILAAIIYPLIGSRCKTRDKDDFPETTEDGRCLVCATYEEADKAKSRLTRMLREARIKGLAEALAIAQSSDNPRAIATMIYAEIEQLKEKS